MRSPWLQLMLLLLYLFLVLVAARLLDLVLWYQHGVVSTQLVDPLLLSVRQLKLLLDSRGVSYDGFVEKSELVQLLEDSAEVMQGEVEQVAETAVPLKDRLKPPPASSFFTGGAHFYEEVEDTRDSVWLVQVVTSGEPMLDDYKWRLVCGQLEPFAIRTGTFDCRRDYKLCEDKGWTSPLLVLAMPKGTKPKDKVVLQPFSSNKPQVIVDWVRQQLSVWVRKVEDVEEIERDWLHITKNDSSKSTKPISRDYTKDVPESGSNRSVQVLLLTHLLHPPLFLAALSIKFTGRIRFGMLTVKKGEAEMVRRRLKLPGKRLPSYLVVTPEKTVVYGKRKLEYFNLRSMNVFLRGIQPETNDIFLCSLVLLNMLVTLTVFLTSTKLWWRWAAHCLWTLVSYNLCIFSAWLLLLAAGKFAVFGLVIDRLLQCLRLIGLSSAGSVIRTDLALLSYYPVLFIASFILYAVCATWAVQVFGPVWLRPSTREPEVERRAWWEVLPLDSYWLNYLFRPMASLSRPSPPSQLELEEGIEMLIERLAVPNFWLQPVIPTEYIKDLPVWQHRGWNVDVIEKQPSSSSSSADVSTNSIVCAASPQILERMMDGEEPASLTLCCCACSRERVRFRSNNSPKSRNGSPRKGDTPASQTSQCLCSMVPGWSGSPKHKCKGPFTTPNRCQSCRDCCENIGSSTRNESMCVTCSHKSTWCQWREDANISMSESEYEESDFDSFGWTAPRGMLPTPDCAVCLEPYRYGTILCGLPCGHNYHHRCIMAWLQRDNHHCPVCRWPAYRSKNSRTHLHRE